MGVARRRRTNGRRYGHGPFKGGKEEMWEKIRGRVKSQGVWEYKEKGRKRSGREDCERRS